MLAKWLKSSLDHRIGNLLSSVQDGLCLFGPESRACEHTERRLIKSLAGIPTSDRQRMRDVGVRLAKEEAALFGWSEMQGSLR